MKKLEDGFSMDKYGLHVRLVDENDAEFILKLRTDSKLSRFINSTIDNLEKQKEWIKKYKEKEREGKEYYFIYYYDNKPVGLNRIYDIHETDATGGSWVCKPGLPIELPVLILIIVREIIFEMLDLCYDRYDIRKKNLKVLWINKLFDPAKVRETELDYFFELPKETFELKKEYLLDLLNVKR
ncbi:hypothetical protein [uncultured Bacteroides sp.]|uniref:GNAT family N-acetyltransferase n=1 Tax=uncultured Bacteroides sp. TaxID=162156 RepID=UPI002AAB55CC|nr:hypothetical protein [uncultured Bacteroides sp.]